MLGKGAMQATKVVAKPRVDRDGGNGRVESKLPDCPSCFGMEGFHQLLEALLGVIKSLLVAIKYQIGA